MKRTFLILLLFAVLALLANATPYFPLDLAISRTVQSIHSPAFDLLMKAVSSVGGGRVFPFAAVFFTGLILFLNLRLEALYLSISTVLSLLAGSLTKLLVFRPRPADGLVSIYKNLSDRSFPSSHTLVYTVIFGFLFFIALTRLPSSPMRFLPFFVGFSCRHYWPFPGVSWCPLGKRRHRRISSRHCFSQFNNQHIQGPCPKIDIPLPGFHTLHFPTI